MRTRLFLTAGMLGILLSYAGLPIQAALTVADANKKATSGGGRGIC